MRILRVVTRPNVGGPMRQALALWHAHAALDARTLLVTGRCADDEAAFDLSSSGVPIMTPSEALARGVDAVGLCVLPSLGRAIRPLADLRAKRELAALMRTLRPDVVHTHTSKAGWLGRLAAQRVGVRVTAHTYHGHVLADYAGGIAARVLRSVEARLAKRTQLLFAVSQSCADELIALGVARELRVIAPAVPTERFAVADREVARRALELPADALVLGCVGRMVPIKRTLMFVELLALLPDAIGIAVGDGPLRQELERRAATLGGRLRVLPTLEKPELVVAALDLLVLPSRREGFPIVGIEAAAAGVPTLGFRVPGVIDLVLATETALGVEEAKGATGLAQRVRDFVAAGKPRLGPRGAELAARCSPERVARQLLEDYATAADLRPREGGYRPPA